MKIIKVRNILLYIITIIMLLLVSGCSKLQKPTKVVRNDIERYNNPFSISSFTNNWGDEFGIQAPYILRYNGVYYMYIATPNNGLGVKLYKSDNLMDWTYVGNVFNPGSKGETTDEINRSDSEDLAHGAIAPEVRYFNGYFYLYTSLTKGTGKPVGNLIYRSTGVSGTYSDQTTNLGLNKDGTVFIDDDEKMYFLTAGDKPGVIYLYTMSNLAKINTDKKKEIVIDNSNTYYYQAPYMIKKGEYYYLFYSQTKNDDSGYELNYSYSKELDVTKFVKNENEPLLTNNASAIKGSYQTSIFLGPDLLTYYTVYSDENNRLVLSQLKFDGKLVYLDARLSDNIKPQTPDFYAKDQMSEFYEQVDGRLLSKLVTSSDYVAEFNFSGVNSIYPNLYVSYQDKDNYLKIEIASKKITLTQVKNGTSSVVAEGTINYTFSVIRNHTVFVEKRGNKIDIYFNDMHKISADIKTSGGRIGYGTGNPERIAYTAFTSITSSNALINYADGSILARSYLPNNSKLTESLIKNIDDAYYLVLKENDYVSYLVDFVNDGTYVLIFTYNNTAKANKIYLSIDGKDYQTIKLPKEKDAIVSIKLSEQHFTKGLHTITIAADEFEFSSIKIVEKK
ncbi:MAG: family 43 glycosylhydrolase [Bacilli bacterium]|nr:family 43 glycosylhydrolase [Bacilli bacterium]